MKIIRLKAMPSNILLITMGGTINAAPYSEKEGEYPVNSTMTNDNLVLDAAKKICANHPHSVCFRNHSD